MNLDTIHKVVNNKKPVIFSDVDGTIYRHFNLLEETKKDIHWAIKNEADFNICTGNPIQERMLILGKELKSRFIIGSSGAQIYDQEKDEIIKSWHIENKVFLELIEVAKNNNIQAIFWDNEQYYYLVDDERTIQTICEYHFVDKKLIKEIPKLWKGEYIEPVKIEFYLIDDFETETGANKMNKLIENINGVTKIPTHANVEISPLNIDKGSAVKWMVENVYNTQNVSINDVMTVGDSNNDVPMLSLTTFSYGMANSTGNVFKVCHYYTSAVEQNGLGEAIIDYLYRLKNLVKKYLLHSYSNEMGDDNE